jgi:hypothetical protein
MFVYVTYDPLEEKVLCVHDKSNHFCNTCRPIFKKREKEKCVYQIYEVKRKVIEVPNNSSFSPQLQAEILRVESLGIDVLKELMKISRP